MNLDLSLLACLEAVVTEGSFEKAAGVLAITQSAVSQRIRALESDVGMALLLRTRPVQPTPAAQPLLRFARQMRVMALELRAEVEATAVAGQLRIAVNADSLGCWVLPALRPWMLAHPAITLDFVVDDQTQTHSRLRNGEVLGAISSVATVAKGFLMQPLGVMRYICAASPDFVARHFPGGLDIASARKAPALVFNRRDALQAEHLSAVLDWPAPRFPHHFVPGYDAYMQAALLGLGYGMLPTLQCQAALADGQLIDLTPDCPVDVPLYWHTWALDSALTASLGRALAVGAQGVLGALPGSKFAD